MFLIIFIGIILFSRIWYKNEVALLSKDKKSELIDVYAKFRIYNLMGGVLLFGGYFYTITRTGVERIWPFETFAGAIMAWSVLLTVLIYRILRRKNFPRRFTNFTIANMFVQLVAILTLILHVSWFQIYP